jgi:hypothetical protein
LRACASSNRCPTVVVLQSAAPPPPTSPLFCLFIRVIQVAGSAEQFKKVDYEYVAAAATVAKAAGVPYFGLVSAQVGRGRLGPGNVRSSSSSRVCSSSSSKGCRYAQNGPCECTGRKGLGLAGSGGGWCMY